MDLRKGISRAAGMILVVLTCFLAGSVVHADTSGASDGNMLAKAASYLKQGRYEEAERLYKAVIMSDPLNEEAWKGYRATIREKALHGKKNEDGRSDSTARPAALRISTLEENKARPVPEASASVPAGGDHSRDSRRRGGAARYVPPVDRKLLRNEWKAKKAYDRLAATRTARFRRRYGGITEAQATYYDKKLYARLAAYIGAQKKWSPDEADVNYTIMSKDTRKSLEFVVRLRNYSFPREIVPLDNLEDRVRLKDDRGHVYQPLRIKPPKEKRLIDRAVFTVYFPKYDEKGTPVCRKARRWLYLQIDGLQGDNGVVTSIRFPKKLFEEDLEK